MPLFKEISMRILYRLLGFTVGVGMLLSCLVLFHWGWGIWQFSQLTGAFIGGCITLFAIRSSLRSTEPVEPWLGKEQLGWTLIGWGAIMWGIGECFWRYYVLVLHLSPFPSWADVGYSALPILVFTGLLLQPSLNKENNRSFIILDSLIAMGSLLAIGWAVLLGSLATASNEDLLAKMLGLYYPTSDIALLSIVIFLLLRAQGAYDNVKARRYGLLILGLGLSIFAISDFLFNVQQNLGTYVDGTWVDLGWPLGLLTVGAAASLRRFFPLSAAEDRAKHIDVADTIQNRLGLRNFAIYGLVAVLFFVLCLNIFSSDPAKIQQRPVLVLSVLIIVALVVVRQILTIMENNRLADRQAYVLGQLAQANQRMEEQARMIAQRNADLEKGITHLKEVHAQLANGNMRARVQINSGDLLPLAGSFNLMADRLSRNDQADTYLRRQTKLLNDLSFALEHHHTDQPLTISSSYKEFPEIKRLLFALGLSEKVKIQPPQPASSHAEGMPPSTPRTSSTPFPARGFPAPNIKPIPQTSTRQPQTSPLAPPPENWRINNNKTSDH
jgi:hypothetical protein